MNRPITALFAALEALLVVGIGIGIPLVPLTFLWAFQYGLQLDWTVFWRASVDTWLIGHGADVTLTLDPVTAHIVGFPDAGAPFVLSIAALGIALLTALLAVRAGRRIAETPYVRLGTIIAILVFAGLAVGATVSAVHRFARPSLWQGALLPTLVFAVGLLIGVGIARRRLDRMPGRVPGRSPVREWWASRPDAVRAVVGQSLRGGVAAVAMVLMVSGLLLAVMILVDYGRIIALYEGIHSGVLGGIAVTLAEFAFLPNLVVWCAAWLVGPGFAIGAGSSVGPLGTSLGPLPAIPIFGAIPTGDFAFGFLGLLVPVVAGFLVGVFVRPAVLRVVGERASLLALTGLGVGIAGGILLGLLAWFSGGAAGPGRLADVGPDAFQVGLWAALEFAVPAIIGLMVGRPPRSK
ncbi:hypothetical protein BKA04_001078 [Cryobacterium mesophilum]|uniref:Integral membrane protein n=1 Tax=Terrimesophilobacter mesophilus TaxID=433647 RepID=A0A4R8VA58_9MICO|nr:DUF6350 family protein [Terrimesophilobacter mesophilus]MBB5632855.1 hypothetical protein [Terrimesophilobacter mesophilus]TFB79633.1 hypothetical protein E3N84_06015 [Terrimesophilobacter mesophilus]